MKKYTVKLKQRSYDINIKPGIIKELPLLLSDYNENVAYINLKTLEDLFNKNENQRFLEFYFKNPHDVDSLKNKRLFVIVIRDKV